MNKQRETHISKFLSLILRHKPETVGITLQPDGWVDVQRLLQACTAHGESFFRQELQQVVDNNDKKRFEIKHEFIRASQGHSVEVDLGYEPATPPDVLYHGTAQRFLPDMWSKGILKMGRQHVHLSLTEATAWDVGSRHGKAAVIIVDTKKMHAAGHKFFKSTNGVWLTDHVPVDYAFGIYNDELVTDKRVDNVFVHDWSAGMQDMSIRMADGREIRVTVQGFDKVDSLPVVDRIAKALPLLIAGT